MSTKTKTYLSGFTIIELTVVIVVIAILAAVVIVSYGQWRQQLAADVVKSDLTGAASAMENARNFGDGYPSDIPASFVASENSLLTYASGDAKSFCIDGRSSISSNIYYFISSDNKTTAVEGTCAGGAGATPDVTIFAYDTTLPDCTTLTLQLPVTSPTSAAGSVIDWGDGATEALSSANQSHTYTAPGEKIVTYKGPISAISTEAIDDAALACLKEVRQWSNTAAPTALRFRYSTNLVRMATPPTSVTDMSYMMSGAIYFNQNISNWDVSNVTNMRGMLSWNPEFNQPIGNWNTSKVTDMSYMFQGTRNFNQDISSWDTSNVTNMSNMFYLAYDFNQNVNSWNTAKVTNMSSTFQNASSYNQPLSNWNTANVTNMSGMFHAATVFNQPLASFNTAKVTNMSNMFAYAKAFNQPIGGWNTTAVTNMSGMFGRTDNFNQPIGTWSTANVTNMYDMFNTAKAFNQPLSSWNTAKVTNMNYMFAYATVFNQNLSSWNVTLVSPKPPTTFSTGSAWTQPKPVWT